MSDLLVLAGLGAAVALAFLVGLFVGLLLYARPRPRRSGFVWRAD